MKDVGVAALAAPARYRLFHLTRPRLGAFPVNTNEQAGDMSKHTTAQVAQALKISEQQIHSTLFRHPALQPRPRKGKAYLWSAEEVAALRAFPRMPTSRIIKAQRRHAEQRKMRV